MPTVKGKHGRLRWWRNVSLVRAEYNPGTREGENYIKISRHFDRLCFVYQLDANLLYVK